MPKEVRRVGKFKFTKKNVNVQTLLETRVKSADGLFAVVNQLTYQRKRARYKTGIRLSKEDWNIIEDPPRSLKKIRNDIQTESDKLKDIIEGMDMFSWAGFNKRVGKGKTDLLLEAFEFKVRELTKAGRIGSAIYYDTTAKGIRKFTYPEVRISDITVDWLSRFEAWLIDNKKSYTTVSMYARAIRAIFNEYGGGLPSPFGVDLYEIPEASGRKSALTIEQIGVIASAPVQSETERRCRDLWMFLFLCNGININDALRLRYANIIGDEIRWRREKTRREKRDKSETVAFYSPEMRKIVDIWGNKERKPSQFIFPYFYDRMTPVNEKKIVRNLTSIVNRKMKIIGKRLGIGRISTNLARHSFATILMQSGVGPAFISKALSHSSIKTTENYLGSFTSDAIKKNAEILTKYKKK